MRGYPLLRVGLLMVALCLTSILIASVIERRERHEVLIPRVLPDPSAPSSLVPALLTITLSAPAASISFSEPSGRVITIPASNSQTILQPVTLTLPSASPTWEAFLTITWQDPTGPLFARFDIEPHQLKTATLVLDFPGDVSGFPITASFATD